MTSDKITGGVLLLGSLAWENADNADTQTKGKRREDWRKRLSEHRIKVTGLPMRYARRSGKTPEQANNKTGKGRRGQFTMCLTTAAAACGTVLFAPFTNQHSADFVAEYTVEVHQLAEAEGILAEGKACHFAHTSNDELWGVVAIWINPGSAHAERLKTWWRGRFKFPAELPGHAFSGILDELGQIVLPWPDSLQGVDFCLCTPTAPGETDWSADKVAQAAITANKANGKGHYFKNTYESGIRTADDRLIMEKLRGLQPESSLIPKIAMETEPRIKSHRPRRQKCRKATPAELSSIRIEAEFYPQQDGLPEIDIFAYLGQGGVECGDLRLRPDGGGYILGMVTVRSEVYLPEKWWALWLKLLGWRPTAIHFRKAGIGNRLLDTALSHARQQGAAYICGDITGSGLEQEWLAGWYERRGFIITAPRPGAQMGTTKSIRMVLCGGEC